MVIRFTFLLLLSFSTLSSAAQFIASVDRNELLETEHLVLTLSLINSDTRLRAEGINPNIDLTLLSENFELGTPKADNRFNIYRNKGRSTSNISITLFPRKSGKLLIPAFNIEGLSTKKISITVHNSTPSKTPQVFHRSGVLKNKLWVGEQTLAYLDLYSRVEIKNAQLGGNINSSSPQMEITPLNKNERQEEHNGLEYSVTRMSWRIAPLESKAFTIDFPDIWVEAVSGERIRLPFTHADISVQALPENTPNYAIIGKPEITQSPLPETINNGELFSWEITLRIPALANSLPQQLPKLSFPPQLKIFSDEVIRNNETQDNNYTGIAIYRFYITPLSSGDFTLPAIDIPYFDIEQGNMNLVSLAAQTINVNVSAFTTPADISNKTIHNSNDDIKTFSTLLSWRNIAISFFLLWLATVTAWFLSRQQTNNFHAAKITTQAINNLNTSHKDQLLQAMGTSTLEQGLRQYQEQAGSDEDVLEVIHLLQSQHYGMKPSDDNVALQDKVKSTCLKIRAQKNINENTNDPWQTKSFTQNLADHEDQ